MIVLLTLTPIQTSEFARAAGIRETTMHRQSQRERFEKICGSFPFCMPMHTYIDGGYRDTDTKRAWAIWQAACPEGCQAVPQKITAETGHKYALLGEFSESITLECLDCYGEGHTDPDCEVCRGEYHYQQPVPIGWGTIKRIHDRIVSVSSTPKPPC